MWLMRQTRAVPFTFVLLQKSHRNKQKQTAPTPRSFVAIWQTVCVFCKQTAKNDVAKMNTTFLCLQLNLVIEIALHLCYNAAVFGNNAENFARAAWNGTKGVYIMAMNWSFRARLLNASELMKKRYCEVCKELTSFKGVKTSASWDKTRIYIGRKTLGAMLFRGKTLCVALALNPADYAETKYVFTDIGETAKYATTPMLVKLTSDRQVRYLKELFAILFQDAERIEPTNVETQIPFVEQDELVAQGLIKVTRGRSKAAEEDEPAPVVATVAKPALPTIDEKAFSRPKGIVNIGVFNSHFEDGDVVTPQTLKNKGLLCPCVNCLKVLAKGTLTKKLTVAASRFSVGAANAIRAAGGTIVVLKIEE